MDEFYSLSNPSDYRQLALSLKVGDVINRAELINKLLLIQYSRNEVDKIPGTFQVYGSSIEVHLTYQKEKLRIELFGQTVGRLEWVCRHENRVLNELDNTLIFPARHFVTTHERRENAIRSIMDELDSIAHSSW